MADCGNYNYADESNFCQSCPVGCLGCKDNVTCTTCDKINDFRELVDSNCICLKGYYAVDQNNTCSPCVIENCINCISADICVECDKLNGYIVSSK